jgi:hypothetical protein
MILFKIIFYNFKMAHNNIGNFFVDNSKELIESIISNDISITKVEKFDIDMALWLLNQPDILTTTEKKKLNKMFKNRTKGNRYEAIYKLGKHAEGSVGRWTVSHGIGLQGLQRDIRAALTQKYYWDIDMENAQVQLLLQACKKNGWVCDSLEYYCKNRNKMFNDFLNQNELYTRQYIKEEFIKIMFGGYPSDNSPDWIRTQFYPEVHSIMSNICGKYPDLFNKIKKIKNCKNTQGSTCAYFLQTEERKCLMALDHFLSKNGRYMGILIHDGGGVERLDGEIEFPHNLLTDAEQFIFQHTGYQMKLCIKPIETSFVIPDKRILDIEKTYKMMKNKFEQTHFKCISNACYYQILDEDYKIRTRSDLVNAFEHLVYEEDTKEGVQDFSFILKWIKDKDIRCYEHVDLYPPPLKCPDNVYNLWQGYRIEKFSLDNITPEEEAYIQEGFEFIINHFQLLIGDECYDYFMKYNAYLVQYPALRPFIIICLRTVPGLGKERGWYYIIEKIFGSKHCCIEQKIENSIFGNFNTILEGKFFVVLDEMKMSVAAKYEEEIKSLTTTNTIQINTKGLKQYKVSSYIHLSSFSNRDYPWKIETDDRRYLAIDRADVKRPTPEYTRKLVEYTENDLIIRKVFDYFMSIDVSEYKPQECRPTTTFMAELQDLSKSIELEFVIYLVQNYVKGSPRETDFEHTVDDTFTFFKEFIKTNYTDIKYTSSCKKLSLKLNKLNIKGLEKVHKRGGNCWKFNINEILEWCSENGHIIVQKSFLRDTETTETKYNTNTTAGDLM